MNSDGLWEYDIYDFNNGSCGRCGMWSKNDGLRREDWRLRMAICETTNSLDPSEQKEQSTVKSLLGGLGDSTL